MLPTPVGTASGTSLLGPSLLDGNSRDSFVSRSLADVAEVCHQITFNSASFFSAVLLYIISGRYDGHLRQRCFDICTSALWNRVRVLTERCEMTWGCTAPELVWETVMSTFGPGSFCWGRSWLPCWTCLLTERVVILLFCVSCFVEQERKILKMRERLILMQLWYGWRTGIKN